ncbi:AAA family ATPase [Acidithiobacillus ferrooxidans]|nr:AAA family ATPase [Acidithiobacillus ferrooxidans]
MYFKSIEIENIGPIEHAIIEFPTEGGHPKPIIIVGENGTGKSILLSHLVNSLTTGKQEVYEDVEVDQGKVYKYRSPDYIMSGKDFSYSSVEYETDIKVEECQLNRTKTIFESELGYTPARTIWNSIPQNETSVFLASFRNHPDATSNFFKKQCCLYFPVNRFEDPAWLNIDNLKSKANHSDLKRISKYSNRSIICTSPLKNNKNWLLDLIFDRQLFEIQIRPFIVNHTPEAPSALGQLFAGFSGQTTNIYEAVLQVIRVILRERGNIRLGAGTRKNRQIAVMKNELVWVPNLFQLSTGEVQLLNLFLSIVRDYDLSEGQFNNLDDIKGVVIIDEIDSHLHTSHQKEVLPELIASFPNVQFIITTHSPLFLMGMEEKFGGENFVIFNMPNGERVAPADFSEFNAAYTAFKETTRHREEIRMELERSSKPIVFVEGDYDIRYLNKAADLLNRADVLIRVQLRSGDGFGNLDKVWKAYDNPISEIVQSKIICLYDCDIAKLDKNNGLIYRRVLPSVPENPIAIGIENLFPMDTIQKIEAECPRFIDTQEQSTKRIRGETVVSPATKSVNKDEKGNMCNWLCENGTAVDFANFESAFNIIEEIING